MRRWLSVFLVGGNLAYRGLFNWIHPAIYIPTMLGAPLFQLIFFTKLGQFAHAESRDFYIVGNSIQACAMSSVYGMTMAVANERWFGTLGPLLASPASRSAVFLGRGLPVLANGIFVPNDPYGKRSTLPVLSTANKSPEYFCVIPRPDVGPELFTCTAVAPSALPPNATFAQ